MSRGLGSMQRDLLEIIEAQGRPLTFNEILALSQHEIRTMSDKPGFHWPHTVERSMRRALATLVRRKALIVLGKGGPRDPYRYRLSLRMQKSAPR